MALPVVLLPRLTHTSCLLGNPLGTKILNTPFFFMNVPFGGNASVNSAFTPGPAYAFASGNLDVSHTPWTYMGTGYEGLSTIQSPPHPPGGFYSDLNWTVYSVENQTVNGSGTNGACTQKYVAEANPMDDRNFTGFEFMLNNNTTDAGEWHQPYGEANSSVWIDNSFHGPNTRSIDTCGQSNNTTVSVNGSVQLAIEVTIPVGSQNVTAYGTMEWSNGVWWNQVETLTYDFPANFGTWEVYSPSGPNTQGAWAFQYYPC